MVIDLEYDDGCCLGRDSPKLSQNEKIGSKLRHANALAVELQVNLDVR